MTAYKYSVSSHKDMITEFEALENRLKDSGDTIRQSSDVSVFAWLGQGANDFRTDMKEFMTEGDYYLLKTEVSLMRIAFEYSLDKLKKVRTEGENLGLKLDSGISDDGVYDIVALDTALKNSFISKGNDVITKASDINTTLTDLMDVDSSLINFYRQKSSLKEAYSKLQKLSAYMEELKTYAKDLTKFDSDLSAEFKRISNYDSSDQAERTPVELASEYEKNAVIKLFEEENPDVSKLITSFLKEGEDNKVTDEDVKNIKYLIYTAEEPYRTIYLESIKDLDIADMESDGKSYYSSKWQKIYYTYEDSFFADPRGPYTVFFHECGHAIDDLSDLSKKKGFDTSSYTYYSEELGKDITLREAILYDVYYNEDNPHSVMSAYKEIVANNGKGADGDIDKVIKALEKGSDSKLKSQEDKDLYKQIVEKMKKKPTDSTGKMVSKENYEAISDVYGGASINLFRNGYGHEDSYWSDKNMISRELWAEYYSYNMAGDVENLEYVYEYFPTASKVLDSYAEDLGEKYD